MSYVYFLLYTMGPWPDVNIQNIHHEDLNLFQLMVVATTLHVVPQIVEVNLDSRGHGVIEVPEVNLVKEVNLDLRDHRVKEVHGMIKDHEGPLPCRKYPESGLNSQRPGSGLILTLGITLHIILHMGFSHRSTQCRQGHRHSFHKPQIHALTLFAQGISENSLGFTTQQEPHIPYLKVPYFQIWKRT